MTRTEATRRASELADRHFDHRVGITPKIRQGFILRETARFLGEPVPRGIDMPKTVRVEPPPAQDLMAALEASLQHLTKENG